MTKYYESTGEADNTQGAYDVPDQPSLEGLEVKSLPPWAKGSVTSFLAAAAKDEDLLSTQRFQVAKFIKDKGAYGATREEIEDGLNLAGNTVRPRVWELMGSNGRFKPMVREAGERRPTRHGRAAAVLIWDRESPKPSPEPWREEWLHGWPPS